MLVTAASVLESFPFVYHRHTLYLQKRPSFLRKLDTDDHHISDQESSTLVILTAVDNIANDHTVAKESLTDLVSADGTVAFYLNLAEANNKDNCHWQTENKR